jgi:hypothetical protein
MSFTNAVEDLPKSGSLRLSYCFDFENGIEATMNLADVYWAHIVDVGRRLIPLNGAEVCKMGVVDFGSLDYVDLVALPYSSDPIPGNIVGQNYLIPGGVVSLRSRNGRYFKILINRYDDDLSIAWEECRLPERSLPVKVTLGSAPGWLVTRYEVNCSYASSHGPVPCGTGSFNANGGVVESVLKDDGDGFPVSVHVTVSMDFEPSTFLQGLVKTFTVPVTETGAIFFFEPNQVIQRTNLVFDLQPIPWLTDYIIVRWEHSVEGNVVASGQRLLEGSELQSGPLSQYEIAFIPDPIFATGIKLRIDGRLFNLPLLPFDHPFELSDKAILLRSRVSADGRATILDIV